MNNPDAGQNISDPVPGIVKAASAGLKEAKTYGFGACFSKHSLAKVLQFSDWPLMRQGFLISRHPE